MKLGEPIELLVVADPTVVGEDEPVVEPDLLAPVATLSTGGHEDPETAVEGEEPEAKGAVA